jgi:hypothetical protein
LIVALDLQFAANEFTFTDPFNRLSGPLARFRSVLEPVGIPHVLADEVILLEAGEVLSRLVCSKNPSFGV